MQILFDEGLTWYNHFVSMGKDECHTVDNNREKTAKNWFKLDNAGKLYPAIKNARWTSLFRVSVAFLEPIDPLALQQAVNDILPRFPSFAVRLRKGLFWYYLEENTAPFSILKDEGHPCITMRWKENCGYLFRVLYHECRISLEVFHAISDGSGGITFMKTLAAQYLRRRGIDVPATDGILDLTAEPDPQEVEDAYKRLPCGFRAKRKEKAAFHLPATREIPHTLHVTAARISVQALKNEAKKHGVTITEYLTSVMIYVIYKVQQSGKHDKKSPVKVSVPVNMRNFFPSKTLRNFSFFINPGIDPRMGEYTFEEVILQTHHYMRYHLNNKFLAAGIATNVASERNIFIRISPLLLKNLIINGVFKRVGESGVSATLTNLGAIVFPKEMLPHIAHTEIILGGASSGQCNCAANSMGDEMTLVFSRNIRESTLEREVLRFLVKPAYPFWWKAIRSENMSYCVECGVKLGETEGKCPLCQTVVQNPIHPYNPRTPKPFPVRTQEQNLQIDRRYLLGLISTAMLLPAAICFVIDFFLGGRVSWSVYPVGALVLLFVALAVPILVKKHRIYVTIVMDAVVLLGYLKMVELLSGGKGWFSPIVFPVIMLAVLMVLGVTASVRQRLLRELAIPATILALVAILAFAVELLVSSQMYGELKIAWSPFVMLPCCFIALMMYIVHSHKPLREELKKRLHI